MKKIKIKKTKIEKLNKEDAKKLVQWLVVNPYAEGIQDIKEVAEGIKKAVGSIVDKETDKLNKKIFRLETIEFLSSIIGDEKIFNNPSDALEIIKLLKEAVKDLEKSFKKELEERE